MRKKILDMEWVVGKRRKIIEKVWKVTKSDDYPQGNVFSFQFLYEKEDRWIQIARIDNMMHEGKPVAHIHILK